MSQNKKTLVQNWVASISKSVAPEFDKRSQDRKNSEKSEQKRMFDDIIRTLETTSSHFSGTTGKNDNKKESLIAFDVTNSSNYEWTQTYVILENFIKLSEKDIISFFSTVDISLWQLYKSGEPVKFEEFINLVAANPEFTGKYYKPCKTAHEQLELAYKIRIKKGREEYEKMQEIQAARENMTHTRKTNRIRAN